jgi:phosphopantothenoylcysteine decarboxylase / phosphopantothenate---cysteine ligase
MTKSGREVVLGVGAGISAYKACDLLRRLQDEGYLVSVVPTPSSLNFVGSATWEALSGRSVYTQVWENVAAVTHIHLAERADYFLIAPATADLIARIAAGRADDLLTNLVLATTVPIMIVPAMHTSMWNDPATKSNVETLRERGYIVMEPAVGRLTGADSGQGRFPDSAAIIDEFSKVTGAKRDLLGKQVLISAGGTREPIDPVRFIGNRSSGKQGFALAHAALSRGAQVSLVAANCDIDDIPGVAMYRVERADEMLSQLENLFDASDVVIMSAAVADAKPKQISLEKIKKALFGAIELEANPDVIATLTKRRHKGQVIVGFAAETTDHMISAQKKLESKDLDLLYLNDVSGGAIFGSDSTTGSILDRNGAVIPVDEMSKDTLSHLLLDQALHKLG